MRVRKRRGTAPRARLARAVVAAGVVEVVAVGAPPTTRPRPQKRIRARKTKPQEISDTAEGSAGGPAPPAASSAEGEGEEAAPAPDDPMDTVTRVRDPRRQEADDEVSGIDGSTRMEAKRQRRREGREAGRRRAPVLSEAGVPRTARIRGTQDDHQAT